MNKIINGLPIEIDRFPIQKVECSGEARSHIWLQILADILQTELIAPSSEEGAAYGAAILVMVGIGASSS